MNAYAQAIYNKTNFPQRIIKDTIAGVDSGIFPLKITGDMRWDIYLLYETIKEYEQLTNQLQRN